MFATSFLPARIHAAADAPSALLPPLAHAPLDTPLVVTGGFGEFRKGHFHAGLDLGTGRRVGKPVHAPLDGWIERVRASGVGYGRSIYLHGDDGRLLVFGHLDAYDGALAAYVASQQDSSGQYEQDLWPATGRFRVRAGDRIAWTGESGAGGPHLHFEIRLVDMAYNPLRAGLPLPDRQPPSLPSLTLEPLDGESRVEGGVAPRTIALTAAPETLEVIGRVRAIVGGRDGVWSGVDRMVPWSVSADWGAGTIECRFDSVSWATDMAEGDYVYDTGRVRGEKDFVLYAPPGHRPRVVITNAPDSDEAGVILVKPGDAPRTLRLTGVDVAGNSTVREVVLRPPSRSGPTPDAPSRPSRSTDPRRASASGAVRYAALPGGWLRVSVPGESSRVERVADGDTLARLHVTAATEGAEDRHGALSWNIPDGALFEPAMFLAESLSPLAGTSELRAVGGGVAIHPVDHPLRRALTYRLRLPQGTSPARVGLYQDRGEGWEFVRTRYDSAGRFFEGESRGLGRFALFQDAAAPKIGKRRAPRRAAPGAYSRWSLEAPIVERGSGVEARASHFVVDGKRVATEWDGEEKILRWRPPAPPGKGRHRYQAIVVDRAGNTARASGTFVLD